jgi:thiol-disulfide isomerase/thioredoxin
MKTLVLGLLLGLALPAQSPPAAEEDSLREALEEAGPSAVDFIRAAESHLAKYPNSPRRAELELNIAKAALETKDDRRIVLYGGRVLAREPGNLPLLEGVARALLASTDKDAAARALKYARRLEADLRKTGQANSPGGVGAAEWREEIDRGVGKALLLQARASANLGQAEDALRLARQSYDAWPTAEAAREIARLLARSGQLEEAIRRYADAFTIPDSTARDFERASDRAHMGELYLKLKGSEAGLGDLVLEAYDRTAALVAGRQSELRQLDPNAHLSDPMQFTLTGLEGGKLALSSLRGKVVVLDFWATWCGPCRQQHPLYEEVKKRFRNRPDVVFLSINADDDRAVVAGFVAQHNWDRQAIYFDDGLAGALEISMLPLTVLIGKGGQIESRMGFIPDRFVEMLSTRIQETAGNP